MRKSLRDVKENYELELVPSSRLMNHENENVLSGRWSVSLQLSLVYSRPKNQPQDDGEDEKSFSLLLEN